MSQSKNGIWGIVFYAAVLLALIGLLCYGLVAPASAQEDSRTLPILMYHDIVPEGGLLDDYTASVAQLEADLQALAQEGWQTVRLSEVITYVRMGEKVYSPMIEQKGADFVLAFEELEALRDLTYLKDGGTLIVNTQQILPLPVIIGAAKYPENILQTLKEKANVVALPALPMAAQAGITRSDESAT